MKKHKNAAAAAKCENGGETAPTEIPTKVKPKYENRPECRLSAGDCVACPKCENEQPQGFPYKGGMVFFYPPMVQNAGSKIREII